MDLEKISFENNSKEIKSKIEQLPRGFLNTDMTDVMVSEHDGFIDMITTQKNRDSPSEINILTLAKDIKITSYNGETYTEFYYKKTNYLIRH